MVIYICENVVCKKEFRAWPYERRKFCCRQCQTNKKKFKSKKGIKLSEEHRKKISKALIGEKNPSYGVKKTDNQKMHLKKILTGRKKTAQAIENAVQGRKKKCPTWFKDPLAVAQKISVANKGKGPYFAKTSEEKSLMIKKTQETKRLNPQLIKGGKAKYYDSKIGKVRGTYELAYINKLVNEKQTLPTLPKGIKTPFGNYHPDFEFKDYLVEIKSSFTYKVLIGEIKGLSKDKEIQLKKIKWVHENIKPVAVLIGVKQGKSITFKNSDIIGYAITA